MSQIVIVMGFNAAGKSTFTQQYIDAGYHRINRDETGGTIEQQANIASELLRQGVENIVLDNTYPSIESRRSIIFAAKQNNAKIICVWLATEMEDAQLNACLRMVKKYGKLIGPEEFSKINNPNIFPPAAIFNYRKMFQQPTISEGFDIVEKKKFVRMWDSSYVNKAVIFDYDGTLRFSVGEKDWPEKISDVKIYEGRKEKIQDLKNQGYLILGASNQSAVAKGLDVNIVIDCFNRTNELLGEDIDVMFCPHKVPPVTCYCRKPHPGMGAYFINKYKLDPSKCIMVGDQTSDETFAERCGFSFHHVDSFFGDNK